MSFFSEHSTQETIGNYNLRLSNITLQDGFQIELKNRLQQILRSFISVPEIWDEKCPVTIKNVTSVFLVELNPERVDFEQIEMVTGTCFRFYMEREINSPNGMPRELVGFKDLLLDIDSKDKISKNLANEINYSLHTLPASIVSDIINGDRMKHFAQLPGLIKGAEEFTKEWSDDLIIKLKTVNDLNVKLEGQKNAFNFIGLHKGFDNLSIEKKKEYKWAKFMLFIMGALIPIPLGIESYRVLFGEYVDLSNTAEIIKLLPLASLTFLLIYYFRISLLNFQSIRSQIMQIELRKTLCAFIQSYVDYAQDIKKLDAAVLSKFEDVVFTNIMTNEEKVPSTFDGIEQVAGLIGALRGSKKGDS